MTKSDKYLLVGAAAFGVYWFVSKSRALAGLVFSPGAVNNLYLTGGQPVAEITVLAQNTNAAALDMNSFAGNVFSDGQYVGNVYNFQPVTIPANSQVAIPVTIQLQISGLVNQLINAFQTGSIGKNISVNGSANVNGFQLPVNVSFKMGS